MLDVQLKLLDHLLIFTVVLLLLFIRVGCLAQDPKIEIDLRYLKVTRPVSYHRLLALKKILLQ